MAEYEDELISSEIAVQPEHWDLAIARKVQLISSEIAVQPEQVSVNAVKSRELISSEIAVQPEPRSAANAPRMKLISSEIAVQPAPCHAGAGNASQPEGGYVPRDADCRVHSAWVARPQCMHEFLAMQQFAQNPSVKITLRK